MLVGVNIPDKFLFRWKDLMEKAGYADMDTFIISALGIGVRTINQAVMVMSNDEDNVIQFDQNYYWNTPLDK